jgi:hypothetical protein
MEKYVDSVHTSWTTASSQSTVDPHGGTDGKPLESGRDGEGRCGGLATGLTGARGETERPSDSGDVAVVVRLGGGVLRCGRGERCGML